MQRSQIPPITTLYLLLLFRLTAQVDVTMDLMQDPGELGLSSQPLTVTCTNLAPGVCCEYPPAGAEAVTFHHLTAFDIAAVWTERLVPAAPSSHFVRACSGRLLDSRQGPGRWRWTDASFVHRGRGASYITLPRSLPPGEETTGWMAVEGLLGLAWGGGEWFASQAAQRLAGKGGSRVVAPRSLARRDVRAEKGTVYARLPFRSLVPDRVERNGSVYIGNGSDMIFKDEAESVINLTSLFVST
ncbi:MAG: hypothetical protein L6R39_000342 [Caloplaca ligustica]|nr:MAG: hypothetical protein L6R39_000342 [Caloplaca ligustica]